MSGINSITIVGNVGSAPELKYTKNNVPFCRFSVAVNEQWSKNGEKKEATTWFPVVVFNGLSEACANWLDRGRLVGIVGRVRTREYKSNDGTQHKDMQIVAENVTFLGSAQRGEDDATRPEQPGSTATAADDDDSVPF